MAQKLSVCVSKVFPPQRHTVLVLLDWRLPKSVFLPIQMVVWTSFISLLGLDRNTSLFDGYGNFKALGKFVTGIVSIWAGYLLGV